MNNFLVNGKSLLSLMILTILLVSGITIVSAGLDDWTMFHHDQWNTGESTSTGPETNKVLWSYTTGFVVYSPSTVADGRVYIGSYDDKVYCLDAATGDHIWNYTTGNYVYSSPAIADGRVYIGSGDNKVYCFGSAITMDDILHKLESMEPGEGDCCNETLNELDNINNRLDSLETSVDDCCEETHGMLEDIMAKIGLPVGGSMLPLDRIPEVVEFISDNLPAMTLIVVFSLLGMWITRNNS